MSTVCKHWCLLHLSRWFMRSKTFSWPMPCSMPSKPTILTSNKGEQKTKKSLLWLKVAVIVASSCRECALSSTLQFCPYRMRVTANADWQPISTLARNRVCWCWCNHACMQPSLSTFQVAAVAEFYTFARYLSQGLLQSSRTDVYWNIMHLRRNMLLTKLGFPAITLDDLNNTTIN